MKSRIVFLCTLAAFLSPVSVLAVEMAKVSPNLHLCTEWSANQGKEKAAPIAVVDHSMVSSTTRIDPIKTPKYSGNGG
jgi:hypothetical protein